MICNSVVSLVYKLTISGTKDRLLIMSRLLSSSLYHQEENESEKIY